MVVSANGQVTNSLLRAMLTSFPGAAPLVIPGGRVLRDDVTDVTLLRGYLRGDHATVLNMDGRVLHEGAISGPVFPFRFEHPERVLILARSPVLIVDEMRDAASPAVDGALIFPVGFVRGQPLERPSVVVGPGGPISLTVAPLGAIPVLDLYYEGGPLMPHFIMPTALPVTVGVAAPPNATTPLGAIAASGVCYINVDVVGVAGATEFLSLTFTGPAFSWTLTILNPANATGFRFMLSAFLFGVTAMSVTNSSADIVTVNVHIQVGATGSFMALPRGGFPLC